MSLLDNLLNHWPAIVIGVVSWFVMYALAEPLRKFWQDRQQALEALERYSQTTNFAPQDKLDKALNALRDSSAKLMTHARSRNLAVTCYCALRGYNVEVAANSMIGVSNLILDESDPSDVRRNTGDLARIMLGATGQMSKQRKAEVLKMYKDSLNE